jgi:hypothetical protein
VCQADPACVPLNLFGGPGTITPEMLKYILTHKHNTSHQSPGVVSANISGDVFQLLAGSLDFATGYEHRNLFENWTASYAPRYMSDLTEGCAAVAGFPVCDGPVTANTPASTTCSPGTADLPVVLAQRLRRIEL